MSRFVVYFAKSDAEDSFAQLYPDMALYRKYRKDAGVNNYEPDAYINKDLPGWLGFKHKGTDNIEFFRPMWINDVDTLDPYMTDNYLVSGWIRDNGKEWHENTDKTVKINDSNKTALVPKELRAAPDLSYYSPDYWIYAHPALLCQPGDNETLGQKINPAAFEAMTGLETRAANNAMKNGVYSQKDIDSIRKTQKQIQEQTALFLDKMRKYKTPWVNALNKEIKYLKDDEFGAYSNFLPFITSDNAPDVSSPYWNSDFVRKITTDPEAAKQFYRYRVIPEKEYGRLVDERKSLENEVEKELGLTVMPYWDDELYDKNQLKFYAMNPDPNKYPSVKNLYNWDDKNADMMRLRGGWDGWMHYKKEIPESFYTSKYNRNGTPAWYLEHGYGSLSDVPKKKAKPKKSKAKQAKKSWLPFSLF